MIAQYFIMNNVKTIEFISASNKLKDWINKKTTYNERKKIGIKIASNLLNLNDEFKEWNLFFYQNKKKDDLSDCFLQLLWYLKDNSLINYKSSINNI